jgi:glutathione reductase (NADPH)
MLSDVLAEEMKNSGLEVKTLNTIKEVTLQSNGKKSVLLSDGTRYEDVDCLLWAVGRSPKSSNLGLETVGAKIDEKGNVVVDEYQNTTAPFVYALGDVCGKALLTPVAIAAGRKCKPPLFIEKSTVKTNFLTKTSV